MEQTGEKLMTVADVAKFFGVAQATVMRWTRTNPEFPKAKRFGWRTVRFSASEIMAYAASGGN